MDKQQKVFFLSLFFITSTAAPKSKADWDREVKKKIEKEVKQIKKEQETEKKIIAFKVVSIVVLLAIISYGLYSTLKKTN